MNNLPVTFSWACDSVSDGTNTLYRLSNVACGDGVVGAGEGCDDGNQVNGDGCNLYVADTLNVVIGGGSPFPASNSMTCHFCVPTPVGCGNGTVGAGEQCDDGNVQGADNCLPDCTLPCGNGHPDYNRFLSLGGEMCDDGNVLSGDGCSSTCVYELVCGDGFVVPGWEQCDDHNTVSGDGCSSTCTIE